MPGLVPGIHEFPRRDVDGRDEPRHDGKVRRILVTRFISTRLLQMIVVIAIMSFIVYALIGLMPGDPIDLMISSNPRLSPGRRATAESALRPR